MEEDRESHWKDVQILKCSQYNADHSECSKIANYLLCMCVLKSVARNLQQNCSSIRSVFTPLPNTLPVIGTLSFIGEKKAMLFGQLRFSLFLFPFPASALFCQLRLHQHCYLLHLKQHPLALGVDIRLMKLHIQFVLCTIALLIQACLRV